MSASRNEQVPGRSLVCHSSGDDVVAAHEAG